MRYITLVLLNVPIILAALMNIITQCNLRRVSATRFKHQLIIWLIIMVVLVGSFPLYNISINHPPFDSSELSIFDILQTTAIILLFYIINNQRQRIDQNERRLRDLHQELSIRLSNEK